MADKRYTYSNKEENKGGLLLIGILIALILIGVGAVALHFLSPPSGDGSSDTPIGPKNDTVAGNETACDNECLLVKAVAGMNVSYCDEISEENISQRCYVQLANESLDACIHVKDREIYTACVQLHAENQKDTQICDYLEDRIIECKSKIDSCYLLEGFDKKICLALKKGNVSACEEDPDCIYNYSITKNNFQACDGISDEAMRYACRSVLKEQDDCFLINATAKKDLCRLLWADNTDDKLICTLITPGTTYSRDCFTHFAITNNDPNFCTYAGTLELDDLWDCYINYSLATGDTNGCDKIDKRATTSRFTCYYELAKAFGNAHSCELIGDTGQINTCYIGIIMNENVTLNYSYCLDLRSNTWKNKCIGEYAKDVGEKGYCDAIEKLNERDACYSAVEVSLKD